MIKKLCVISQYYPTKDNPIFAFVDTLISQFADMAIECHVIVPTNKKADRNKSESRIKVTDKGNKIYIHCPKTRIFIEHTIGPWTIDFFRINTWNRYRCALKAYREHVKDADAIYAHFWLASGIPAAKLGKKLKLPVFVASGESFDGSLEEEKRHISKYHGLLKKYLSGVIAVSGETKRILFERLMFPIEVKDKTTVIPNGVDLSKFYVMDKQQAKERQHIYEDTFTIGFVGFFCKRKGYYILKNIIKKHPELTGLFIGGEESEPPGNMIFPGRIEHDKLVDYYNAADIFVLPTLKEGCCNAIIEALACGLPVISSDRNFNNEILDDTCAIRINPLNENEIESAVLKLYQDKNLRNLMAKNARKKAEELGILKRAENILSFMEDMKS